MTKCVIHIISIAKTTDNITNIKLIVIDYFVMD